ncbi:MAG: globin [Natronospirillum sp.]|uniref:globin n=1 Tax=Natronospirillum sp. TaxID=2812955 RepID=UPI0025F2AEE2|nr:globin [Natronospirillum sp.]MCH8552521.1 globin [Natronospirillum sp.]
MPSRESDRVFQSYGRVCNNPQFFVDFYDRFMNSSPTIKARFADVDMKQQRHLLRNGIMQLVLHARGMADTKLRDLAKSHSRTGHDIDPAWYDLWLDALIATIRYHDPEYSDEVAHAWRTAIMPGIEIIRSGY